MGEKINQCNYSPISDCLFTSNTERGSSSPSPGQSGPSGGNEQQDMQLALALFHSFDR